MSNEIDRVEFEVENDFKVIIHCKSLENENKILDAIAKILFDKEQEHE